MEVAAPLQARELTLRYEAVIAKGWELLALSAGAFAGCLRPRRRNKSVSWPAAFSMRQPVALLHEALAALAHVVHTLTSAAAPSGLQEPAWTPRRSPPWTSPRRRLSRPHAAH